jgi:nicotinamidase/pyrazinamidase
MKKLLLVIDCQLDFMDGGKLGVNGSTPIMDNLALFIENHAKEYEHAIATVDWHPVTHCSFKDNGGIWPQHCIQYSPGSSIYQPVLLALYNNFHTFEVVTKGLNEDHEEYSIFKNVTSNHLIKEAIKKFSIEEIDVVGIAYDYCVADSVKDGLRELPDIKFNVIKKYCPAIAKESAQEFTDFIENSSRVCLVEE